MPQVHSSTQASSIHTGFRFFLYFQVYTRGILVVVHFAGGKQTTMVHFLLSQTTAQTSKICENVCVLFSPGLFPPPFAVLGCQAILVSDRNKSFRRGSVGLPLSPTKSSRIRSQRPLSPQPAGLGEIYCEERKKSSYFMALSWWNLAKAVLAGGIKGTQRVRLCVTLPIPESPILTPSLTHSNPLLLFLLLYWIISPSPWPDSPPTHRDDQDSVWTIKNFILKLPQPTENTTPHSSVSSCCRLNHHAVRGLWCRGKRVPPEGMKNPLKRELSCSQREPLKHAWITENKRQKAQS